MFEFEELAGVPPLKTIVAEPSSLEMGCCLPLSQQSKANASPRRHHSSPNCHGHEGAMSNEPVHVSIVSGTQFIFVHEVGVEVRDR
jgi:hypothetical protein